MYFETDVKFNIVARWVIESDISDKSKVIYSVLCGFADSEGKCYPSRSTIAKRAGCSIKSVDRAIKDLETIKAIKVFREKKPDGSNKVNQYFLNRFEGRVIQDARGSEVSDTRVAPAETLKENHIKKTTRRRDFIFEELAESCGIDWNKATKNELGRLQKATKQLKEIKATPEEIRAVADWYKKNWKEIEITPTAIVSNYSSILRRVEEKEKTEKIWNCSEMGHKFRNTGYEHIDYELHHCIYCAEEKTIYKNSHSNNI
ncbi:MAG: hypothetical protein Unbinned1469contig1000_38 [Prokaryotic dsDNA virus sp.]|jgi:hypothetical protein|nr:MAG: hypothetical protein Unbinned1469contig1000_38 [Prokaryotic dsDNA virus sp.]|tara:strand:+ start:30451 stop:31227 length:777 start_codon:yes stop_codon:yes gene_type:complete